MLTRLPINREHLCHTHAPTLGIKPGKVTNLLFLQIREAFANTHRCTDKAFIHHSKCKRKHNFSHFEIAVWQRAIVLQIPGRRGNHGNFFQNTPVAHGGKKRVIYAPRSPLWITVFTLPMEWNS